MPMIIVYETAKQDWINDFSGYFQIDILMIIMYLTLQLIIFIKALLAIFAKTYQDLVTGLELSVFIGLLNGLVFVLWLMYQQNLINQEWIMFVTIIMLIHVWWIFAQTKKNYAIIGSNDDYDPVYSQTMELFWICNEGLVLLVLANIAVDQLEILL